MPVADQSLRILEPGQDLHRPYLDVEYINPHTSRHLKAIALIDTGADHCIVPAEFAEILGHNLERGELSQAMGISGEPVQLYKHTMQIKVHGHDFVTNEIQIAFSPELKKPILGVRTFLSNFVLKVNYPSKTFSLKLPTNNEDFSSWGTP